MKKETQYLRPQLVPSQETVEQIALNPELEATILRFFQDPIFALDNTHDDSLHQVDPFRIVVTDHRQLAEVDGTGRTFHAYTIYDIRNPHPQISLIADEDLSTLVFTSCDLYSEQPLSEVAIQQSSAVLSCDFDNNDPRRQHFLTNLGISTDTPTETAQPTERESTALISKQTAAVLVALGLSVSACTGYPTTPYTQDGQIPQTPTAVYQQGEPSAQVISPEDQPNAEPTPDTRVTSTPAPTRTPEPDRNFAVGETTFTAHDFTLHSPEVQSELLSKMEITQKEELIVSLMGILSSQEESHQDTLHTKKSFLNALFNVTNQNIWLIDVNDPNIPLILELKPEWAHLDFRLTPYSIDNGRVYSILYCEDSENFALENGTIVSNTNWKLVRNQPFRLAYADSLRQAGYTVPEEHVARMLEGAITMNQFLPPEWQYRTFHIDGSLRSEYPGALNDLFYSKVTFLPATFRDTDFEGNQIPPEITAYISTHEPAHTVYAGIVMNLYEHSPHENYQRFFDNFYQLGLTKGSPTTELFREGAYFGYVHAGHPHESPSELFASTSSLFLTGDQNNRYQNQRAFLANINIGVTSGNFSPDQVEHIRTATQFVVNFYATHPGGRNDLFCPELMEFVRE